MKVTIEIKEITIENGQEFVTSSYPKDGIYLVTDISGYKRYFIKYGINVCCISDYSQSAHIFDNIIEPDINELEPLEEIEQVVSESFALKMVAIVLNKEKFNDVG